MIYQENITIVNSKEIIHKERKNLGENIEIIVKNIGKEVLFIRPKA